MGFAELHKQHRNEVQTDENETDDSDSDYQTRPYANIYPKTAVAFEDIVEVFYPEDIWDDGPVTDANGDIGLILEAPNVVKGELCRARGRNGEIARFDDDVSEYIDYKVINSDENEHSEMNYNQDGELKSITPSQRAGDYDGVGVDQFDEDHVTIWLSGNAAKWAARILDVNGEPAAKYDDGEHNQGLVEHNPMKFEYEYDDPEYPDVTSRFARLPQMRDLEFKDHGGGFINLVHLSEIYDGAEYGYYVFIGYNDFEGEKVEEATILEPVKNPDAVEFEDAALMWHDADNDDDSSDDDDDDTDRDGDGGDAPTATSDSESFVTPNDDDSNGPSRKGFLLNHSREVRRFMHNCVIKCGLQPGDDPFHAVAKGNEDKWETIVQNNYDGERSVTEDFKEYLREQTAEYASVVDGDIAAARDGGIPVDN